METFEWVPRSDTRGDVTLRVRTAQFGDGYSQSSGDGINGKEQSWPLTLTVPVSDAEEIVAFLDRHAGYKAFFWTPPLGQLGLYRADRYTVTPNSVCTHTISVTFTQTFHP